MNSNSPPESQPNRNFKVAVYCGVYEVRQMSDIDRLRPRWEAIWRYGKVDTCTWKRTGT
jgi:hypothetical protein